MKLTIAREILQDGLSAVAAAVPARSTLPVLTNVRIEAKDGAVRFTASNLDLTIVATRPAEVAEPSAITVPAKKFISLVRELPAGVIQLATKGETLGLKAGRANFKLNGMSASEYPDLPTVDFETGFEVDADVLRELIARTAYAVSTEESRPILTGVLWQIQGEEMRMVATNGHRLAKNAIVTNGKTPEATAMIVPPAALLQIDRMIGDAKTVRVGRNANFIGFKVEGVEVYSRLIDGAYPNYEQVIPKDNDKTLIVSREAFEQAIRRMAVVASEQTHKVTLHLGGDTVRLTVESPDTGQASDEVEATFEGEPMQIAFNAAYLLETLRKVPSDEVKMTFKESGRATVITPAAGDTPKVDSLALVMPLRLDV